VTKRHIPQQKCMNRLHRMTEKTLGTMHSVRDRQTDGQHYHANGWSYCMRAVLAILHLCERL